MSRLAKKIKNIDITKIEYHSINNENNKKYINIALDNNDFVFQTPLLYNNSKLIDFKFFYQLDIPLCGKSGEHTERFIDFLNNLDQKILFDGKSNKDIWFKDHTNLSQMKYKSLIRSPLYKNEFNKNGIIRIKFPKNTTDIRIGNARISDDKLNQVITNCYIRLILKIKFIRITNYEFGLFLEPLKILIEEIEDYDFVNDSDEEIYKKIVDVDDYETAQSELTYCNGTPVTPNIIPTTSQTAVNVQNINQDLFSDEIEKKMNEHDDETKMLAKLSNKQEEELNKFSTSHDVKSSELESSELNDVLSAITTPSD